MSALPALAETIEAVRQCVREARTSGLKVGLVPTMGALHAGHSRLIEVCRDYVDYLVVSIFVNPTQFGPSEDFENYPRTLEADRSLCAQAGADLIFLPTVKEMYPDGPIATFIEVPGLSETLEGASRPGHFRGVATVVAKLFHIVGPDLAAFGEKDFQQLAVIQRMVNDLNMPVQILPVPTVREPDGLALSSRNRYLNSEERQAAVVLWKALEAARKVVETGERSADRVRQVLLETIESEQKAQLDYAEVADADTLEPLNDLDSARQAVALLAVRVGPARLIDNARLSLPQG